MQFQQELITRAQIEENLECWWAPNESSRRSTGGRNPSSPSGGSRSAKYHRTINKEPADSQAEPSATSYLVDLAESDDESECSIDGKPDGTVFEIGDPVRLKETGLAGRIVVFIPPTGSNHDEPEAVLFVQIYFAGE